MSHRYKRTLQQKAEQKARTEKNRLKLPKKKKTAKIETVERKQRGKEIKRKRYLDKIKA